MCEKGIVAAQKAVVRPSWDGFDISRRVVSTDSIVKKECISKFKKIVLQKDMTKSRMAATPPPQGFGNGRWHNRAIEAMVRGQSVAPHPLSQGVA